MNPVNLSIERQVNHWIDVKAKTQFSVSELPVTTWEYGLENRSFYTIPDLGQGFKISRHHGGEITNPNDVDRNVKNSEVEDIQQLFESFFVPSLEKKIILASPTRFRKLTEPRKRLSLEQSLLSPIKK